jgi:uncharacterized protein YlxP (DUF503 family)
MVIGLCTIELHLPGSNSLKDKRSVLKSVIRRARNEFNVGIAEVDEQDTWRSAVLGVVTVSNDAAYVHGLLTQVVNWIERSRLDVDLVDYQIEML